MSLDTFLADLDGLIEPSDLPDMEISSRKPFESSVLGNPALNELMEKIQMSEIPTQVLASLASQVSELVLNINLEISSLKTEVEFLFSKRIPTLGQLVTVPGNFLKVVEVLIRDPGFSKSSGSSLSIPVQQSLQIFLPKNELIALSVSYAGGSKQQLSPEDVSLIRQNLEIASQLMQIESEFESWLVQYVPVVAPNLSVLLGPSLTGKLIASAGGLKKLASIPSQNIEAIGSSLVSSGKFLTAAGKRVREGLIYESDIIQKTVGELKKRAVRLVVGKTSLSARADAFGNTGNMNSTIGESFRKEIEESLNKALEKGPAREEKALPVPESKPAKKRGGRRSRALKAKFGQTDVSKEMNRVKFGTDEEMQNEFGKGVGMLNMETGGSMRGPQMRKRKLLNPESKSAKKNIQKEFARFNHQKPSIDDFLKNK